MKIGEIFIVYNIGIKSLGFKVQGWSSENTRFSFISFPISLARLSATQLTRVQQLQEWWTTRNIPRTKKGFVSTRLRYMGELPGDHKVRFYDIIGEVNHS